MAPVSRWPRAALVCSPLSTVLLHVLRRGRVVFRHGMLWLFLIGLCSLPPRGAPAEPGPAIPAIGVTMGVLSRAHAHNDYEHEHPLLDALEAGFASVEADVWLVDG